MLDKVMIGCPVRNRAWVLPKYLTCLAQLDYPLALLQFCFILNDCSDNSLELLSEFANYPGRQVSIINADFKQAKTRSSHRGCYSFKHLAKLRNLLLTELLSSDCQYLFSVDSDILVSPSSLNCLLANEKEIVSALVCNGHEIHDPTCYNVLIMQPDTTWVHHRQFPRNRLFEVDCTGAAILIKREVISHYGIRYSSIYGPEDIGFCLDAKRNGLKIYCDGRIEFEHIMIDQSHGNIWY